MRIEILLRRGELGEVVSQGLVLQRAHAEELRDLLTTALAGSERRCQCPTSVLVASGCKCGGK